MKTAALALAVLTAEKRRANDGRSVTYLEHHLRQYTRRNTSDFFIHKDLKSFLSRELDFYLKNEVLNLDEMEAAGEKLADGWFQTMRVIKAVGGQIIEFLHQIEEFQKMLWEKKKFITEAQYCFFAGSGTTAHAVINLNREDGGRRKFILVEMAHYFDTVLLPRIKKVTFTPEWKDGKPKRAATAEEAERSPRIVKYIRLESYEDALNNIAFDDASEQQAPL